MTTNDDIMLRPAVSFAFFKVLPLILFALTFLLLAWYLSPYFVFFSIMICGVALYRMCYIRSFRYLISLEYIRISRGILFKREDRLEMYCIKDYIITQPISLQLLHLMNLTLKSKDSENAVITLAGIPSSAITDTIRERVQRARHTHNIYELN
jgi:uncharacterized membrane protein YdbT with pleckstrin-like domain